MLYQLDFSRQTTKTRILEILSITWPISKKKIHLALRKQYRLELTYQAVHRALNELGEEGAVKKNGREYLLNDTWVEMIHSTATRILNNYAKQDNVEKPGVFQRLRFQSIAEAWEFLLVKANSGFFGSSEYSYIQVPSIFAYPIPERHAELIRQFSRTHELIVFCRKNGPVEKLASNFLRKLGVRVLLGVACAQPINVSLIGNSVISVHILYRTKDRQTYDLAKGIKDILKQDVFTTFAELMGKQINVEITVNRNPEIYEDVLKENQKLLKACKKNQG